MFVAIAAIHSISWNSIFKSNTASFGGGAVFASRLSRSTISGNETVFISNSANFGGAVMSFGEVNITGSSVLFNNTALLNGGAITTADSNLVFGGEVEVSANSALSDGGVYSASSTLYILPNTTVYFQNNLAMQQGGAIFVEDPLFIYCSNMVLQDRNSHKQLVLMNAFFSQLLSQYIVVKLLQKPFRIFLWSLRTTQQRKEVMLCLVALWTTVFTWSRMPFRALNAVPLPM